MTKKRPSEIFADEKTYFSGKVTWKCHLRNFFLQSKISFEIEGKCFIVLGGMDASDYLLLQSINELFYFTKSNNQSSIVISRPSLKGMTHFLNEKKTKSVPVFEGQKMVTLMYRPNTAAETWRRVWVGRKKFRAPRFLNDDF